MISDMRGLPWSVVIATRRKNANQVRNPSQAHGMLGLVRSSNISQQAFQRLGVLQGEKFCRVRL